MVSLITLICAKSNFKRIIHNQTLPLTFFSSLRAFNSCMAVIFRVSFLDSIMSFLRSILRLLATIPCRPFWLDGSDPPAAPFSFFFFCSSFLACFNFFSISNLFIEMIFTNYSQSHTKHYKINNYDPRRIIYTSTCNSTIYNFVNYMPTFLIFLRNIFIDLLSNHFPLYLVLRRFRLSMRLKSSVSLSFSVMSSRRCLSSSSPIRFSSYPSWNCSSPESSPESDTSPGTLTGTLPELVIN